jgi:hypothetical protein
VGLSLLHHGRRGGLGLRGGLEVASDAGDFMTLVISSVLTLVLGAASLASGIIMAKAGGAIRHHEFRSGPAPESHS